VYIHATSVNNLLRGDPLVEFNRVGTGLASFGLAALAVAAALAFAPAWAVLIVVGIGALWTTGATIALREALALPLVEPVLTSLAALGATVGYRLVVADRMMAAERARRRAQEAEMASAAAIQRAMLPIVSADDAPDGRLDVFAQMIPAKEVGGDLFDIIKLEDERLVVTVGDVCGKGVPASLFMAITQTIMRLVVRAGQDFQAEINQANKLLVANNREDMFTTLFCGVIDASAGTMTYCNCGHNPPLVLRKGESKFEPLHNCGPPLGVMDTVNYVPRSIALAPGDSVFLYTDGVSEAEDLKCAQFGMQRLEQALLEVRGQPARAMVEHVVKHVVAFAKGAPQSDDITCLAVIRNEHNRSPPMP
jgi:serine phosphatase RsbU (regulator of sigma subunit)